MNINDKTAAPSPISEVRTFIENRATSQQLHGATFQRLELAHNDLWAFRQLVDAAAAREQQLTEAAREVIRTELFFQDHPQKFAAQKALRAALAAFDGAALAPSQAPQWRPIAEAPRDGTRFWYLRPVTVVSTTEPARIKYDVIEVWRKRTTPDGPGYWTNYATSMADYEVSAGWFLLSDPDKASAAGSAA